MRRLLSILTAVSVLSGPTLALGADHIVDPAASHARVEQSAERHDRDAAILAAALARPEAGAAAAALGVRLERLRAGVAALSDAERHDLATRASALASDPASGYISDSDVHDFLIVFLVVAIVAVVLSAAGN